MYRKYITVLRGRMSMAVQLNQNKLLINQLQADINTIKCVTSEPGKSLSQVDHGSTKIKQLKELNAKLREKIDLLMSKIVVEELLASKRQYGLPGPLNHNVYKHIVPGLQPNTESTQNKTNKAEVVQPSKGKAEVKSSEAASKPVVKAEDKTNKDNSGEQAKEKQPAGKKKGGGAKGGNQQAAASTPDVVDVSRLDLRVGKIMEVCKHPDADSLYVEKVDVGDGGGRIRTVVSGLVKHVPLDQMDQRVAVFMCNLKPAKMRGVLSEGMIMCASDAEKGVQILNVPTGANIGDRVVVPGYDCSKPDEMLNPKKKIWEGVQPDLRVNQTGLACYKGVAWKIEGVSGDITSSGLTDVQIK